MFFLISILSIYIPFEVTEKPAAFPFTEYDFRMFCTKTPTVITLIVSDLKSDENKKAIDRFSNAMLEFSDAAYFIILNRSQVPQLSSRFHFKKPYMVLINHAQISINCEIPEDDLSLATTIHFWTTSLRYTAKSVDDLFELLGPTRHALILRELDINDGFKIISSFVSTVGTTEIISATDKVFEQLDMQKHKFLFFRRDDNTISPLPLSFNTNLDGSNNNTYNYTTMIQNVMKLGKPNYSVLESQDLQYQNFTYLGLLYDSENEFKSTSINHINSNISTILDNLHDTAPEFKTVLIGNEFFNAVESVTHQKVETLPDLIVFNYQLGYYYPNDGAFNNIIFGSEKWQNNAKEYIEKIRNDEIEKKYYSENENEVGQIHNNFINTIVGSNFQQFVNDPENDVLVIFRKKNNQSKTTTELSSTFGLNDEDYIQIAEEIFKSSENDQNHLKIGIIDPSQNSSPKRFPFFLDFPHVELYPKQQKDRSKPLFGRVDRNSIIRFLKDNNININIPIKNLTFNEALLQMEEIVSKFDNLPPVVQFRAQSYVSKVLQPIVDIDPFNSPFGMTPEEIVEMKKNARNSQWLDSIDNLQTFTIDSQK